MAIQLCVVPFVKETVLCLLNNLSTLTEKQFTKDRFSSVAQSCPTLCVPMDCSAPGLPVHYQLLEFTQTQIHGFISGLSVLLIPMSVLMPVPNCFDYHCLLVSFEIREFESFYFVLVFQYCFDYAKSLAVIYEL